MVKRVCALSSIVKILAFIILLSACSGNRGEIDVPADIIPRDTMISALVDMHLIEGAKAGQKVMGDTVKINIYYAKLYQKYGVTEKEYEKSFRFYSEHPEAMNKMYQEVIERLNKIQMEPPRTPLVERADTLSDAPPDTVSNRKSFLNSINNPADSLEEGQGQ